LRESWSLVQSRSRIRLVMRSKTISAEFRERLMLAVTEVNHCRYCSYAHTKMALKSGVNQQEISWILDHNIQGCPEEEIPAIIYAQHWAETDGRPESEIRKSVINRYGTVKVEMIEVVLRMIRTANLAGNSFDFILFRLSLGKWGV
jgi:AhpD family alkylhydroperoxidase